MLSAADWIALGGLTFSIVVALITCTAIVVTRLVHGETLLQAIAKQLDGQEAKQVQTDGRVEGHDKRLDTHELRLHRLEAS